MAALKYQVILADPPWRQFKGGRKAVRPNSSGGALPYKVASLDEIEEILLSFTQDAEQNSLLFLWTIDKYLHDSEQMAQRLGYKLHARMVWNKVTGIPAAFTIRYGHEYLLYLYKGRLLPVAVAERGKIHSVFTEKVRAHSQKPVISYEIIERLYPDLNKIELFARSSRTGWDNWGDEAPGSENHKRKTEVTDLQNCGESETVNTETHSNDSGDNREQRDCPTCAGKGYVGGYKSVTNSNNCPACHGLGKVKREETS